MKCPYCGAETEAGKIYCRACGIKLIPERRVSARTTSVEVKRNIPRETTEQPAASTMDFPKTRAALEDIFGPEQTWTPSQKESAFVLEEETLDFPVTPCDDWMDEEAEQEDQLPPVYSTAPLREDVLPPAPVPETTKAVDVPIYKSENLLKLPAGRSLVKMILLGLITAGIYPMVIWSRMVTELNITASRNDGKRTMPYFGMLMLVPITVGVFAFVWMHKFCNRVGGQLAFRKCNYRFGAKDFWLWCVLGSLILVGPCVFVHKLVKSMNLINNHFNTSGC